MTPADPSVAHLASVLDHRFTKLNESVADITIELRRMGGLLESIIYALNDTERRRR